MREDDGWHARWRGVGVDNDWVDEYVRGPSVTALSEDAEDQRHETLHDAWAMALRSRTGLVLWDDAECAAFAADLAAWHGAAEEDVDGRRAMAFAFRADGSNASSEDAFTVSCPRPHGRAQYRALGEAAYVWGGLRGLKAGSAEDRLVARLTRGDAEDFVRCGAHDLRGAGYTVEGVDVQAKVSASVEVGDEAMQDSTHGGVRLRIKVAGEDVTAEEIRFLLEQNSTFVFFRDRWIEVDRGILREALRALEKAAGSKANPISFALGIGAVGRLEIDEVEARGTIGRLVADLRRARDGEGALAPTQVPGLMATLRDYQARGVEWIRFLTGNGFGALLADDMGLGKTMQAIAWMLKDGSPGRVLVVAPLTLLANWRHELAAFAPSLRVYVHQGEFRHIGSGFTRTARSVDVVVTSYALLVRDHPYLAEVAWDAIVLDEAQAIKNPDTHAARAVRALGVPRRLALTGTPIENSVADIWSIEEFLNPGLLGDRKSFEDRFVKPLAEDPRSSQGARLRRALEPFVMRRLKSDPDIAGELGEKREVREYCTLGPAERAEYERALADYRMGERRQGDVFALLTRLKLACDGFDGERVSGGKADRLVELVGTIFENGESVLVFTQYAKVGTALKRLLEGRLGCSVPFLHGGLSASAREAEIARFIGSSGPSAFILSLKAGGFGLNLTKATYVIHYDRWWNPAVEGQATDRAHRIGQEKTVFVHAFVTEGTVEEHVEEILARKESLAGLIRDGEAFWSAVRLDREDGGSAGFEAQKGERTP